MTDAETRDIARAVGSLEGRLSAMDARMDRHEAVVKGNFDSVSQKLDAIGDTLATARGAGWAAAQLKWLIPTLFAGGVGAAVHKFFSGSNP